MRSQAKAVEVDDANSNQGENPPTTLSTSSPLEPSFSTLVPASCSRSHSHSCSCCSSSYSRSCSHSSSCSRSCSRSCFYSDSTSSSDDIIIPQHKLLITSTSMLATVEDQNLKVAPTLTQGKITPEILHQWERLCKEYFRVKAISEKRRLNLFYLNCRTSVLLIGLRQMRWC